MQKQVFLGLSTLLSFTTLVLPAVALDARNTLAAVPNMLPVPQPAAGASTVRLSPASSESHLQKGLNFLAHQQLDQALIEFLKAAKDNPLNTRAYYEEAVVFNQKGLHKLAQSALQQALAVNPDYKDARVLLATTYLQGGDISQAAGELARSLGLTPVQKPAPTKSAPSPDDETTWPAAMVVQTPHGRLALPKAASPASDVAKVAESNNQTTPKAESSSDTDADDKALLDKILGRVADQPEQAAKPPAAPPAPPPVPDTAPVAKGEANDSTPPGVVTKTISASSVDAQQLLKQIKTANQQHSFSWPNPLGWLKHGDEPAPTAQPARKELPKPVAQKAAKPPAPSPAIKLKTASTEQSKGGILSFIDKLLPEKHASLPAVSAAAHISTTKGKTGIQRPAIAPLKAPVKPKTIAPITDDASDFAIHEDAKPQATQPPTTSPQAMRGQNEKNAQKMVALKSAPKSKATAPKNLAVVLASKPIIATAAVNPVVQHGVERIHVQPARQESVWKHLFTLPGWLVTSAPESNGQEQQVKPTDKKRPPKDELPQPAARALVTLPPVPPLSRPNTSSSNVARHAPLLTTSINTVAVHSLLQLLPPDVAVSVELALLPKPMMPAPHAVPAAVPQPTTQSAPLNAPIRMSYLPMPPTQTVAKNTAAALPAVVQPQLTEKKHVEKHPFSAPALVTPAHYILKAATPKLAPVPPPEDEWTKRMRYLLANGTGTLAPGEAFMFSEETGEGLLFLRDKSVIKRKLSAPQTHEVVAQLRRPDVLSNDSGLRYSLVVLGKLLDPQNKPGAVRIPNVESDDNFLVWLKRTFSF